MAQRLRFASNAQAAAITPTFQAVNGIVAPKATRKAPALRRAVRSIPSMLKRYGEGAAWR